MSIWASRIYVLPQKTSDKFVALFDAGYFEQIKTDIHNATYFTSIHTDELRTELWRMTDEFREDCKLAVKIINKYYKKYLQTN